MRKWVGLLLVSACCVLSGCGGGDSSDGATNTPGTPQDPSVPVTPVNPPPATFTQRDIDSAANAKVSSTLNLADNSVKLEWTDSFAAGTDFVVDIAGADGKFARAATVPGLNGAGGRIVWSSPNAQTQTYRVSAVVSAGALPLAASAGGTSIVVAVPQTAVTIITDKTEPLTGAVTLSLSGGATYRSVTWYSDLRLLGTGAQTPGAPLVWDSKSDPVGNHLILALVEVSDGVFVEYRRAVAVANPDIAASVARNVRMSAAFDEVYDVTATSANGIAKVAAVLDGAPFGEVLQPNGCPIEPCGVYAPSVYRFVLNERAIGSGTHALKIFVTDKTGAFLELSDTVRISNAPTVTLDPGLDGSFISGNVTLRGKAVTDKASPLTTTVKIGSLTVLTTTQPDFSAPFDASGLGSGRYVVTATTTDNTNMSASSTATVYVQSPSAAKPEKVTVLQAEGELLAAAGDSILYRAGDRSIHWLNTVTGLNRPISGGIDLAWINTTWLLGDGFVVAAGRGSDCQNECLYFWGSDLVVKNLTNIDPQRSVTGFEGGSRMPQIVGRYVVWKSEAVSFAGFRIFETDTATLRSILLPAGTNSDLGFGYMRGGVLNVLYTINPSLGVAAITNWNAQTGASENLNINGNSPRSDGERVIWTRPGTDPLYPGLSVPRILLGRPLAGGPELTYTSTLRGYSVSDGLVRWGEDSTGANSFYSINGSDKFAVDLTTNRQPLPGSPIEIDFQANQAVYTWKAASGKSQRLLDILPVKTLQSGNKRYFTLGNNKTVYRVVTD